MPEGGINDKLIALMGYGWTGLQLLMALLDPFANVWFVDGTGGSDSNSGKTASKAFATIQAAVTRAAGGDIVLVLAKTITDYTGDPTSYAETVIIPATHPGLAIIGISRGLTQGGLPQIKKGSGTTALITVRAAGCLIMNLGFNGASSTGGGILLDDDYAAKTAFGTTIMGCHFKNCKKHATNGGLGGAIMWSGEGNAWQVRISNCRFYKNVADIVLIGTSNTVPQDVVIEDCIFSGPAASVDINIITGGSGINGLIIRNCDFQAFPAIGSGSNAKNLKLNGSVGLMSNCTFGCTGKTFGATGDNLVPTTMLMAKCTQEVAVGDDNYQSGNIART